MCIVSLDIPESIRQNTRMDAMATTDFARQMVAIAYYVRLQQPISDCARIARMSVDDFVLLLHSSGIDSSAISLLDDIREGYRSGEEKGWHTTEQVHALRAESIGTVLVDSLSESPRRKRIQ